MSNKFIFIMIAASIAMAGCSSGHINSKNKFSMLPEGHQKTSVGVSDGKEIALTEYKSMTGSTMMKSGHIPSGLLSLKSELDSRVIKPSKHYTEVTKKSDLDNLVSSDLRFTFNAENIDIKKALVMFATQYSLNIIPDMDIDGKITVSFRGLTLEESLKGILSAGQYYALAEGNIIYIKNEESAIFQINYPRGTRAGNGSVSASMGSTGGSSGGSSGSGGSSSGGSGGSSSGGSSGMSITSNDSINFLDELRDEIEGLLTKDKGSVTVNKLSGTILVRDKHVVVESIRKYLKTVDESIHRQVVIVASIMEVSNNNTNSVGVDWSAVANRLSSVGINTATAIINPLSGVALVPSIVGKVGLVNGKLSAVVSALAEQGAIEIVSNPHLRTMNNQPALIKVGTDRTFFRTETLINNTTAGSTTTTNDIPEKVTIGLVMSITPQISEDGDVIIDISPVITSLSGADVSANGSTAPRLDIRQISSLVKVKSGEPIIIGGLISKTNIDQSRGLPVLSDMKFIGGLFKTTHKIKSTKELVIFITPYIVN